MPKLQKNKVIFDAEDWLSDVDYLSTDQNYQRGSTNLVKANSFDPARAYGYAQPGFLPFTATNSNLVTGSLRTGVKVSSDVANAISDDGKIHEITNLVGNGAITNAAPFPHTIAGMSPFGRDMVRYYVGTTPFLFFSYHTTTFWDVGRYDLAAAFNDTYMSTTAASPLANPDRADGAGFAHPMVVGDNNILYMGDRNFVHAFNGQVGANGTYFSRVLTLPLGYVITSLVNYQFYLVVYAYKTDTNKLSLSETKAFFWDTFSSSFTFVKDLNANIVTEAVNFRDTMICFVLGNQEGYYRSTGTMEIFDGSNFVVVKKGIDVPIHGGAQVVGDNLFFLGDGALYAYRGLGNRKYIHEIYSETGAGAGMLRAFSNIYNLFISTGSGAVNGLRAFRGSSNSSALVYTKVIEPEFPEYMEGKLKSITVVYQQATSGGRELKLEYLADAAAVTVFSGKTTITNLIERYEYNADGTSMNNVKFKQLQLYLTWGAGLGSATAPVVSRVEFEFELINIPNN